MHQFTRASTRPRQYMHDSTFYTAVCPPRGCPGKSTTICCVRCVSRQRPTTITTDSAGITSADCACAAHATGVTK
eukprot:5658118-Pleurochrysis_carterae.AAC.2